MVVNWRSTLHKPRSIPYTDRLESFYGTAHETPELRWVLQVGDKNFNEKDDDWWWDDDEYPFAEGLYLKGYTNQPDFYKKTDLQTKCLPADPHVIEVNFTYPL